MTRGEAEKELSGRLPLRCDLDKFDDESGILVCIYDRDIDILFTAATGVKQTAARPELNYADWHEARESPTFRMATAIVSLVNSVVK